MSSDRANDRSVTQWLADLGRDATDDAARKLWGRYFDRLVHLARARLRSAPRGPSDEEDVALSAFDSFCRGAAAGRFPSLGGRDDLWRLLVSITARKALAAARREGRLKRGGGRVVGEAALAGDGSAAGLGLDAVAGDEPDPAFAVEVAEECRRMLGALDDDLLRRIALLRMEGYENEEIADRLGCDLRSVERKLAIIRKTWEREAA